MQTCLYLQTENRTLTIKKRKINIQMCRTFPKLGFMHYSIWSGNSLTYFKPSTSAVKFSRKLLSRRERREREENKERAHSHVRELTDRNLRLAMQFTVQIQAYRHWEWRPLLVTEVEQEFCVRWALASQDSCYFPPLMVWNTNWSNLAT